MQHPIIEAPLTPELQEAIYKGFSQHAIATVGFDGFTTKPVAFEVWEGAERIGVCVVQVFWGSLYIKYLIVNEQYRGQGIASRLVEHALAYGKANGCTFASVATMSFQAPLFYQKLGFRIELKRAGFATGAACYYLRKDW